nr:EOG090X0DBE [Eurycercus lamellatus]
MAASMRYKLFQSLCCFSRLSINSRFNKTPFSLFKCINGVNQASFHTTTSRLGLMDFFDDPKNFGASEVKAGRSWTLDELRIKSNVDLHKLWFVLLKERNMLLTMEHNCREGVRLFPSPERIDKVEESMEHLEQVIRERNDAYWQLEVGEPAPVSRPLIISSTFSRLCCVVRAEAELLRPGKEIPQCAYYECFFPVMINHKSRQTLSLFDFLLLIKRILCNLKKGQRRVERFRNNRKRRLNFLIPKLGPTLNKKMKFKRKLSLLVLLNKNPRVDQRAIQKRNTRLPVQKIICRHQNQGFRQRNRIQHRRKGIG